MLVVVPSVFFQVPEFSNLLNFICEYKDDPIGSDKAILIFLFFSLSPIDTPAKVPPVPTAQTNPST